MYNLGYRISRDDASLFYSGDTRQPSARDGVRADFVIHESTYSDRNAQLAHDYGHSTASQAARAATSMGARRLFLTHIGGDETTDAEILREVRAGFPDSTVAEDRSQYRALTTRSGRHSDLRDIGGNGEGGGLVVRKFKLPRVSFFERSLAPTIAFPTLPAPRGW